MFTYNKAKTILIPAKINELTNKKVKTYAKIGISIVKNKEAIQNNQTMITKLPNLGYLLKTYPNIAT